VTDVARKTARSAHVLVLDECVEDREALVRRRLADVMSATMFCSIVRKEWMSLLFWVYDSQDESTRSASWYKSGNNIDVFN
jgi:hypothetical protein